MELVQRRHKTSKFAPEDSISRMPDIVITNILDRLPLQDAVRTGILSRNWRYKWTMLSRLVFDEPFFKYLSDKRGVYNYVGIISRILLHVSGAITKFVLSIDDSRYPVLDAEDVNNWILFLSRKGIKDLTLVGRAYPELSTHLFSCLELKHLKIHNFYFNDPPLSFYGFPNLLSLNLRVDFEKFYLGEFLNDCPLLEILTIVIDDHFEGGKVKLTEIPKHENLKMLTLRLFDVDEMMFTSSGAIFELLGCFPNLQELNLDFQDCELTENGVKMRFPTAIPCLKALKLSSICLEDGKKLSCAFELIRSFPKLQTLEITADNFSHVEPPLQVDYNSTGLLHIQSVMFEYQKGSENEVCLIKYLLACSPILKNIVIRYHPVRHSPEISSDEKLMFARKLLNLPRASPVAKIDFC